MAHAPKRRRIHRARSVIRSLKEQLVVPESLRRVQIRKIEIGTLRTQELEQLLHARILVGIATDPVNEIVLPAHAPVLLVLSDITHWILQADNFGEQ